MSSFASLARTLSLSSRLSQVNLSPLGSGLTVEKDSTVDLYCGKGTQILQWVGFAACSRLAYKRGKWTRNDVMACF